MKIDINEKSWCWDNHPTSDIVGDVISCGDYDLKATMEFASEEHFHDNIVIYYMRDIINSRRKMITHIFTYKEAQRLLKLNQI